MRVAFLGGAYESRSSNVSAQECINLYYEPPPDGEQHEGSLVGTDGASVWADCTETTANRGASPQLVDDNLNPVRGMYVFDDANAPSTGTKTRRLFIVIRHWLFEWQTGNYLQAMGSPTALSADTGRISMAGNNVGQVLLAEDQKGWLIEQNSLTEITDENFIPSSVVAHQDGYFITTEPGTNRFRYSALLDGSTWPAENFVTAEGRSDTVEFILSDRRELWVFGDRSTEVYYNSGNADIPFQRFQNGYIETGLIARWTAQKFDNSIAWLTQNDRGGVQVVRAGEGWNPVILTTPEVAYQMQQYPRVDDAFAYTYQYGGHEFYVITFPSANATWAYDALTKKWHRRAHIIDGKFPGRERFNCHVFYQNQHLFGDYQNGRIHLLDDQLGYIEVTDPGEQVQIPRVRTSPATAQKDESRFSIMEFQLDMEEGGDSDNVWLSYSKDGGHTWSNERARDRGGVGKYAHRLIWRKLGRARNWIFRIRTWSTGKTIIKGAIARVTGGE